MADTKNSANSWDVCICGVGLRSLVNNCTAVLLWKGEECCTSGRSQCLTETCLNNRQWMWTESNPLISFSACIRTCQISSSSTSHLQLKLRQSREQQEQMQCAMVSAGSLLVSSYLCTLSFLESHQYKPYLSATFVNLPKRKLRISWLPPQTNGTEPVSGRSAKLRSTRPFESKKL